MAALNTMLTESKSERISPYVSSGTVDTITITKANASGAIAALEIVMAADNAAEMVETGVKEAQEALTDIVNKRKIVQLLVHNGKHLAGVEVEEEPPPKKQNVKGNGKGKAKKSTASRAPDAD